MKYVFYFKISCTGVTDLMYRGHRSGVQGPQRELHVCYHWIVELQFKNKLEVRYRNRNSDISHGVYSNNTRLSVWTYTNTNNGYQYISIEILHTCPKPYKTQSTIHLICAVTHCVFTVLLIHNQHPIIQYRLYLI